MAGGTKLNTVGVAKGLAKAAIKDMEDKEIPNAEAIKIVCADLTLLQSLVFLLFVTKAWRPLSGVVDALLLSFALLWCMLSVYNLRKLVLAAKNS